MTVAVPIERFAGDVVGVLVAEVNLKYIWEVVSRIKVGQAGYAYVVSREGDLIAHPDISLVLQKRQVKQLSQVQTALAGAPARFVAQPNLAGQQVFAAFATIPELGWAVLLERPAAEAYAPLYASILRTGILLLVGLGMAVLASLLIGRRVVRPLTLLQHGAARLGSGDLDYRLTVTTADEFQTLADEFNRMASQLQGHTPTWSRRSRHARRNSVRPSSSRPLPAKFSNHQPVDVRSAARFGNTHRERHETVWCRQRRHLPAGRRGVQVGGRLQHPPHRKISLSAPHPSRARHCRRTGRPGATGGTNPRRHG